MSLYRCHRCAGAFETGPLLLEHLDKSHPKGYQCDWCTECKDIWESHAKHYGEDELDKAKEVISSSPRLCLYCNTVAPGDLTVCPACNAGAPPVELEGPPPQQPAAEGKKFDSDKPPMELLSHNALTQIAEAFGYGARRYGRHNYRAGIHYSRIISASYRHLGAFNSGENLDPDSRVSHAAHLAACAIMLLDMVADHPELDDRFKKGTK